jgi:hypothetical protein
MLDVRLARDLGPLLGGQWRVTTVRGERWRGLRNGALVDAMAQAGMHVLVTADRKLHEERRGLLLALGIGVVLVPQRRVRERASDIAATIRQIRPGALTEVR